MENLTKNCNKNIHFSKSNQHIIYFSLHSLVFTNKQYTSIFIKILETGSCIRCTFRIFKIMDPQAYINSVKYIQFQN